MQNRIELLRKKFVTVDAFFVTNFYNILYLSGFKPLSPDEREGYLLVTKKNTYLFTDGRYTHEFAALEKNNIKPQLISYEHKLSDALLEIITQENITILGFESDDVTHQEYKQLKKKLKITFKPTSTMIKKIREIKDVQEIDIMRNAGRYSDECLKEIISSIKVGQTEKEIAVKIEFWLKQKGLELAFDPIVAVDHNSASIHYASGNNKIKKDSIILIDMGTKYQSYCSDITRMVFMGTPNNQYVNFYSTLLDAQEKTIQSIGKVKKLNELDILCRKELQQKKLPLFTHGLGHGVGLEVHENPHVFGFSKDLLTPGQVFTIEPGVYVPNNFGMRIEDTIYINNNKQPELLTQFPKEILRIL